MKNIHRVNGKIYITNDEEIKEGDWMLDTIQTCLQPIELATKESIFLLNTPEQGWKKIILTDNTDLIKDGVQAIDDEFLECFVKNPSCEFVDVKKECCCQCDERLCEVFDTQIGWTEQNTFYKIITPKEQQKQHLIDMMRSDEELGLYDEQETLDEVAEKESEYLADLEDKDMYKKGFIEGAKWQQQQNKNLYSEEDMTKYALYILNNSVITPKEWFNQFKKQ